MSADASFGGGVVGGPLAGRVAVRRAASPPDCAAVVAMLGVSDLEVIHKPRALRSVTDAPAN